MARFDETVNIQTPDLRTGGVQRALSLADRLEGFRTRSLGLAQEQAVQRGIKSAGETELQKEDIDGREVTISPQKKEKRFIGGIEINAHNKTLQAAYMASLDNDTRNGVNDIVSKNADNLAGFDTAIEGFRKGVMKGVDPAIRQAVEIYLSGRIDSARTNVQAATVKRESAEAKAEINTNAINASNEAYRLARNGDRIEAAEELVKAIASIDELGLPPDVATKRKREVRREVEENFLRNGLDNTLENKGIPAAIDELTELEKEVPKGWTPDEWNTFIEGERADLNRQLSRQKAGASKAASDAINALKDYEKAASLGFDISPQETAVVANLVKSDDELQKRFDIVQRVKSFSLTSAADRRQALADLETGKIEDVDQYAAQIKADSSINKAAQEDGMSLGIQQGLVEDTPIDFSNPDSFAQKQAQADMLSKHYGVEVSPLKDGEADALADRLPAMTTPEKITLAQTLQKSPAVWGQLSKKNAGVFAMAGASGDVVLMDAVFKGQELLDAKLAKAVKPADYLDDFHDLTQDIYDAENQSNILRASIAYYAQVTSKDGEYDSGDFEKAVEAVSGGIGEINGYKLELPRGVDEDDFSDLINDIEPETIDQLGGVNGMTSERAAELIPQGRVRSIGDGEYIVELEGGVLFKPDGEPFTITYDEDMAADNKAIHIEKNSGIGLTVGARQRRKIVGDNFGDRPDGTKKGRGFLGVIKTNKGNKMTEFSIGVEIDGKETLIPTIVPTLTRKEITLLKTEPKDIPSSIVGKATKHAKERIKKGLSPFADGSQ